MTITQLQYVLAVAEYQNFTLAAEKSYVTQPTLSMQVQKLEDELGVLIFDRSKKPIKITEAGKKIVAQARNIVNEAGRIRDIVDQETGEELEVADLHQLLGLRRLRAGEEKEREEKRSLTPHREAPHSW